MSEQKTVVVIGGSGGIGRAIVDVLMKDEFIVHATFFSQDELLHKASGADRLFWHKLDATEAVAVADLWKVILKTSPTINGVVFVATLPTAYHPLMKLDWKDFTAHFNVQVGTFFHTLAALRENLSAIGPCQFIPILTEYCQGRPPAGLSDYVAAKMALQGFARTMVAELAKYGCRVNMISPGITLTELTSSLPPKFLEIAAEQNPLKRLAQSTDVAAVVKFLLSEQAAYLNGVNIPVNGGSTVQ